MPWSTRPTTSTTIRHGRDRSLMSSFSAIQFLISYDYFQNDNNNNDNNNNDNNNNVNIANSNLNLNNDNAATAGRRRRKLVPKFEDREEMRRMLAAHVRKSSTRNVTQEIQMEDSRKVVLPLLKQPTDSSSISG
jgi:hypothetical protein